MSNRYEHTNAKSVKIPRGLNRRSMYRMDGNYSTVYSTIPETDNDLYVISQAGDRLDILANQFYGDVTLWWYIAKANNLTFMTLPVGTKLRIPASTQYAIGV